MSIYFYIMSVEVLRQLGECKSSDQVCHCYELIRRVADVHGVCMFAWMCARAIWIVCVHERTFCVAAIEDVWY